MNIRNFSVGILTATSITWAGSMLVFLMYITLQILIERYFEFQNLAAGAKIALVAVIVINFTISVAILMVIRKSWKSRIANSSSMAFSPLLYFIFIAGAAASFACPILAWKLAAFLPEHVIGKQYIRNLIPFGVITASVYVAAIVIVYPYYLRQKNTAVTP